MSETKKPAVQECIEFLDDIIEDGECGIISVIMDAEEGLPILKEIKGRLEELDKMCELIGCWKREIKYYEKLLKGEK